MFKLILRFPSAANYRNHHILLALFGYNFSIQDEVGSYTSPRDKILNTSIRLTHWSKLIALWTLTLRNRRNFAQIVGNRFIISILSTTSASSAVNVFFIGPNKWYRNANSWNFKYSASSSPFAILRSCFVLEISAELYHERHSAIFVTFSFSKPRTNSDFVIAP